MGRKYGSPGRVSPRYKKPTLRTYEMICWYFSGMASLEELETHIARLQNRE